MSKIGLLCEGGGTKAAYTAAVLECFLDEKIEIENTYGISAGAMCLLPYVSNQKERCVVTGVESASRKEAVGLNPILHEGAIFGINSTYDFVQSKTPLDLETFHKSKIGIETALYDMLNGEVLYYTKDRFDDEGKVIKAACSLMLLTKAVEIEGKMYMDGGLVEMIPVKQALKEGCDKVIFISTKEANYIRKPAPKWQLWLAKIVYRKYPTIAKDLAVRHVNYQEQWKIIQDMEKVGKALVLRPTQDMGIKRSTTDYDLLSKWYQLGYDDTKARIEEIRTFLNS